MTMLRKFVQIAVPRQLCRSMSMTRPEMDAMDAKQLSLLDETCMLVDEDDRIIGEASKRDCHAVQPGGKLLLHRAFSVYLFNSKNELLLQKRSPYKITYPGCYTNTVCSHPLASISGETEKAEGLGVRRAAQRRLAFELGIPPQAAPPESLHYITRIHYQDNGDGKWGEHELAYILFLKADLKFDLNLNEISEVKYVGLNEIDKFIAESKDPLTPWFRLISQSKLKHWWENLDHLEKITDHTNIIRY